MNCENSLLSERTQSPKTLHYMIPLIGKSRIEASRDRKGSVLLWAAGGGADREGWGGRQRRSVGVWVLSKKSSEIDCGDSCTHL